jgi:hypothetical protein
MRERPVYWDLPPIGATLDDAARRLDAEIGSANLLAALRRHHPERVPGALS